MFANFYLYLNFENFVLKLVYFFILVSNIKWIKSTTKNIAENSIRACLSDLGKIDFKQILEKKITCCLLAEAGTCSCFAIWEFICAAL